MKIKNWKDRIEAINAIINPLIQERNDLEQKILEEISPFKIGDIIQWGGKKGRVIEIKEWVCGEPMWKVQNIKKDGTVGATTEVRPYMNAVKP